MLVKFRNGYQKEVRPAAGKALIRARIAVEVSYETRDMADKPKMNKVVAPATASEDGLELLGKEELHALAKEKGLSLHHNLGADKVRAALREQ